MFLEKGLVVDDESQDFIPLARYGAFTSVDPLGGRFFPLIENLNSVQILWQCGAHEKHRSLLSNLA